MTRRILFFAAAIVLCTATPALAGGEGYTPINIDSTVNDDGSVTVTGENCPPGGTVTYEVRRGASANPNTPVVDSGSTVADDAGDFEFRTDQLPNGRYAITVTCGGATQVLTVSINRGAAAPGQGAAAGGGNLATTGTDGSIPMARLGVILVAAGGVAVYAGKKRQGRRAAFVEA